MSYRKIKYKLNKRYHLVFYLIVILIFTRCYKEIEIHSVEKDPYLSLNGIKCGLDPERGMLLVPIRKDLLTSYTPVLESNLNNIIIEGVNYKSGDHVDFRNNLLSDSLKISFKSELGRYYTCYLFFTTLPVIQIYCKETVHEGPKTACQIIVSDYQNNSLGSHLFSNAGIEIRGRSNIRWDKKNYSIELWDNSGGNLPRKEKLLNMRNDDDWNLDAMYIDKARMRNKINMQLWNELCEFFNNKGLTGKPFVKEKYFELFVNMDYKGLYCLTEVFDRKQLDLKSSDHGIEGMLYKTEVWTNTTKFLTLADTTNSKYWDGWEQKYPDPDTIICWRPIYNFSNFIINSSDEEFIKGITQYINIDNAINYMIFVNIGMAYDNMGTNMFYARYDSHSPFNLIPWDMDASWGRNWDSTFLSNNYFLGNRMYYRLFKNNVDNCNVRLNNCWNKLRSDIVTDLNLKARFINEANILFESGSFEREKKRWPEMQLNLNSELDYINHWIDNRLIFLDDFYSNFNYKKMLIPN
jgi:spore coat protein H